MNKNSINIIGRKQNARKFALQVNLEKVEGILKILDKDFRIWSNFDGWGNMVAQQWFFQRAIDVYKGTKIDILCNCCDCCDSNSLLSIKFKNISREKCYSIKAAYIINKIVEEINIAEINRQNDGTYTA